MSTAGNFELKASANNTPEMVRRQIQISGDAVPSADCNTPEIVRIRTTTAGATVDNVTPVASTTEERTESREDLVVLRRHGHIVEESSCDVSQDLRAVSGAQSLTCTSTNPSQVEHTHKVKLDQMPNRQVRICVKKAWKMHLEILQCGISTNCFLII